MDACVPVFTHGYGYSQACLYMRTLLYACVLVYTPEIRRHTCPFPYVPVRTVVHAYVAVFTHLNGCFRVRKRINVCLNICTLAYTCLRLRYSGIGARFNMLACVSQFTRMYGSVHVFPSVRMRTPVYAYLPMFMRACDCTPMCSSPYACLRP